MLLQGMYAWKDGLEAFVRPLILAIGASLSICQHFVADIIILLGHYTRFWVETLACFCVVRW